jgi:hypothetical protein
LWSDRNADLELMRAASDEDARKASALAHLSEPRGVDAVPHATDRQGQIDDAQPRTGRCTPDAAAPL